ENLLALGGLVDFHSHRKRNTPGRRTSCGGSTLSASPSASASATTAAPVIRIGVAPPASPSGSWRNVRCIETSRLEETESAAVLRPLRLPRSPPESASPASAIFAVCVHLNPREPRAVAHYCVNSSARNQRVDAAIGRRIHAAHRAGHAHHLLDAA